MMALETTPHFGLPLPHPDNNPRTVDVPRLRAALTAIDGYLKGLQDEAAALGSAKADKAQVSIDIANAVSAAISDLLNGAPEAYDTLKEIADKLADNDDVVSAILSSLALKANSVDVYTKTEVDTAIAGKIDIDAQTISAKVTATQNARLVFKDIGNNIRALFSLDRLTNAWSVITRHPTNGDINKLEPSGETAGVMTLNGRQLPVIAVSTGEPVGTPAPGALWAQVE